MTGFCISPSILRQEDDGVIALWKGLVRGMSTAAQRSPGPPLPAGNAQISVPQSGAVSSQKPQKVLFQPLFLGEKSAFFGVF